MNTRVWKVQACCLTESRFKLYIRYAVEPSISSFSDNKILHYYFSFVSSKDSLEGERVQLFFLREAQVKVEQPFFWFYRSATSPLDTHFIFLALQVMPKGAAAVNLFTGLSRQNERELVHLMMMKKKCLFEQTLWRRTCYYSFLLVGGISNRFPTWIWSHVCKNDAFIVVQLSQSLLSIKTEALWVDREQKAHGDSNKNESESNARLRVIISHRELLQSLFVKEKRWVFSQAVTLLVISSYDLRDASKDEDGTLRWRNHRLVWCRCENGSLLSQCTPAMNTTNSKKKKNTNDP